MTVPEILIRPLAAGEPAPYPLLLLADPAPDLVAAYLREGACVVATVAQSVVGVYVLRPHAEVAEIKNIAVAPEWQGRGIGKRLVADAARRAVDMGAREITVGTGNSSLGQLAFYQKCGFRIVSVERDFFAQYAAPITENGIPCLDLVRLSRVL